jgi:hypothetical protein
MAPNGTTNIRRLSYQPPIASESYLTIKFQQEIVQEIIQKNWPYTDPPV